MGATGRLTLMAAYVGVGDVAFERPRHAVEEFRSRLGSLQRRNASYVVVRAGFGLFHGMIPAPLLACQLLRAAEQRKDPGRRFEDSLDAKTRSSPSRARRIFFHRFG